MWTLAETKANRPGLATGVFLGRPFVVNRYPARFSSPPPRRGRQPSRPSRMPIDNKGFFFCHSQDYAPPARSKAARTMGCLPRRPYRYRTSPSNGWDRTRKETPEDGQGQGRPASSSADPDEQRRHPRSCWPSGQGGEASGKGRPGHDDPHCAAAEAFRGQRTSGLGWLTL